MLGDLLKVRTRDGLDVDVKLAADTPIRGITLADVTDITPDTNAGFAAIFVTNTNPGGYWEDQGYNWFSGL